MPVLKIDGKEIEVEKGTNLIIAALKAGVYIPHYCYHPLLPVAAQCRMCFVKIEGMPRPTTACTITVDKDMVVDTKDEKVRKLRNLALEMLLQHHPVDCPVCPRSGECDLQNFTYIWGPEKKRYDGKRRLKGWSRVSEKILLFKERCVLCTRCVRYLEDFVKVGGITVSRRGFLSDLVIFPEKFVNSNYSGNIVDLCPVGALVDEATVYLPRAWRTKKALTRCPLCEKGCRIVAESWKGKIVRIKTFDNMLDKAEEHLYTKNEELIQPAYQEIEGIEEIGAHSYDKLYTEDLIICDIGRWGWREFFFPRDENFYSLSDGKAEKLDWESFKGISKRFFAFKKRAIFITPFATNEEMLAFKELAEKSGSDISLIYPIIKEGDNMLLKPTRAPNFKGGEKILGGINEDIIRKAMLGEYDAVILYSLGADKTKFDASKIKSEFLIVMDNFPPQKVQVQALFFPATLPYEKKGTYTFEGEEKKIYPVHKKTPNELDFANFLLNII